MTFNEFINMLGHLQHNYSCPACNKKFVSANIDLVASSPDEGLLFAECPECGAPIIVAFTFLSEIYRKSRKQRDIKNTAQKHTRNPISQNDVLDMYNFLKNLQGDLSSYLTNDKK